jgi:lipopolysaccharide export system protein LptA
MRHRTLAPALALATLVATSAPRVAVAEDVEVGERAGEAIGKMADAVSDFRLTALPSDLHVEARSMVFDYRKGQLLYEGAVHVKHGDVRMDADELSVTFEPKNPREVKQIKATGNVRVKHETETASGQSAIYDPTKAVLTLTGKARLGSGPNTVEGEKVIVYLDEGRAVVEGGDSKPVRAYIEPKSKETENLLKQDEKAEKAE